MEPIKYVILIFAIVAFVFIIAGVRAILEKSSTGAIVTYFVFCGLAICFAIGIYFYDKKHQSSFS